MREQQHESTPFEIREWRVDPSRNEIRRGAEARHMRRLVMDVLVQLVRNSPDVVTSDVLIESHWPHAGVGDHGLKTVVSELRRTLDDDTKHPRIIETIPKRGYRLIAPVRYETYRSDARGPLGVRVAGFVAIAEADDRALLTFGEGLHAELVHALTQLSRIELLQPDTTPARDGDHVVSGTLRRNRDNRVRVTVHLLQSGRALWSDDFEWPPDDIIARQIDTATKVACTLSCVADAQSWLHGESTEDASLALLRGMIAVNDTAEGLEIALAHVNEALQLDPNFARAISFKARIYRGRANWFQMDINDAVAQVRGLVGRALSINPTLSCAWSSDAYIKLYDCDFDGAEASIKNAERYASPLELRFPASYYTFCGRFDEALALIDRNIEATPDLLPRRFKGQTLHYARRYTEAIKEFDDILARMPGDSRARLLKGQLLESRGHYEEAVAMGTWFGRLIGAGYDSGGVRGIGEAFLEFARATERGETRFPPKYAWRIYTWAYARLGEPVEAVRWMEHGWNLGDRWEFLYLRVYDWPGLDELRAHPAFQQLIKDKLGNPPTCPGVANLGSTVG